MSSAPQGQGSQYSPGIVSVMRVAMETANRWSSTTHVFVEVIGSLGFVYDGHQLHVRLLCASDPARESRSYASYLAMKRGVNQRRRDRLKCQLDEQRR